MTEALSELVGGIEDLIDIPLEFTRNLAGVFQSRIIAAFSKPIPKEDPLCAYRYLNSRRQVLIDSARQRPLIRMQDKNYTQLATIAQERSCRFEEIAADSGEAGVVIRGGDYLGDFVRNLVRIEEDLHLSIDPIGTQPDWKTRWGGKITQISVKRDSSGIHTVELIATANREHFKTTLIGSTPLFPPELQPIHMWMLPANIRTGCFITMFIQLARLFFPLLSIPTNIANPAGWLNPLGPDALLNFDPLSWPIQTQFVNVLLDQSRTSLITAAWSNFHDATIDPLRDAGCTGRMYTWFTDDKTSPHPELELLVGKDLADLARPHRNCLIAAFEDHSGHEGPTGTLFDGPINLFAKTLDDLITTTILPVDEDNDGEVDPVFQKLFGTAPKKPWAGYRDGQHSGIIESGYHQHKGPTKTIMTGGRSPKLVNDLQTFGIRYAISQIAQAVALAGELPAVEGLDNLYQKPKANWTISSSPGNATQIRSAPWQPATWPTRNGSNSQDPPPTPSPQCSTCGSATSKNAPSGPSRPRSATVRPTSSSTTSCSMTGCGSNRIPSSTSTKCQRLNSNTSVTSRSPTPCRSATTPKTKTRSPKASKPCRPSTPSRRWPSVKGGCSNDFRQ
jgi:hypothetical protein